MPSGTLDLDLEGYFARTREQALSDFEKRRAVSRGRTATRLSELDRLRSPSREIILRETEEAEDDALANLLAELSGREFEGRMGLEEQQLRREQFESERGFRQLEFDEAGKERRRARLLRKRETIGRAVGGIIGTGFGQGEIGADIGMGLSTLF